MEEVDYDEIMETYDAAQQAKKCFDVIDAETLIESDLEPVEFVVDELLSVGLHILAGAPKVGKSWLALQMCLSIALGNKLWNFQTHKGTVLYLSLEDTKNRIKERILKTADIDTDDLNELFIATESELVGEELFEQVDDFLSRHTDTKLMVVDTLQKIRNSVKDCTYSNDYAELSLLKDIAEKYGIAILLLHHTRKQGDKDPFNQISGTTGVSGVADSSFVLLKEDRSSPKATLYCTGRDIEQRELKLEFDSERFTWDMLSDSVEQPESVLNRETAQAMEYVKSIGSFSGTASELVAAANLETEPSVLSKKIRMDLGTLSRLGFNISFQRQRHSRKMCISYTPCDTSDGSDGKIGG